MWLLGRVPLRYVVHGDGDAEARAKLDVTEVARKVATTQDYNCSSVS